MELTFEEKAIIEEAKRTGREIYYNRHGEVRVAALGSDYDKWANRANQRLLAIQHPELQEKE